MLSSTSSRTVHAARCYRNIARKGPRSYTSSAGSAEEYDVVIVGGGPAGLALAGALGSKQALRESLKVALVEAGDLSKVRNWAMPSDGYSNRIFTLGPHIETERTSPIEEMQVWDGVSDARITFSASELGLDNPEDGMARLTENLNLQRGLLRYLQNTSNIHILDKTKVQTIDSEGPGTWPLVQLDNSRVLKARLLVGADGFNSPVRTFAQIPSFGWAYDTQAIVATMHHSARSSYEGPNTTAYQRFLPTGPIAFLPLSPTVSSLVWSTKPPLASALQACEPLVLARMINAAFRLPEISIRYLHDRIFESHQSGKPISDAEIKTEIQWREQSHAIDMNSAYSSAAFDLPNSNPGIPPVDSESLPPLVRSLQAGSVASFPLRFNHTESYVGEGQGARTVLVGDAAHTIHPLAGQGLNLGLGDVECLARCIENAVLAGGDIGSSTALLPYTQERYFENHKVMSVCDKLHKLYSYTSEPVVMARSMGLEVLNEFDSIKAALMATAGSQPRSSISEDLRVSGDLQTAFTVAAKGLEGVIAANKAASAITSGLAGLAVNGLQALAKAAGEARKK
ncbi:putative ubiquinone biosynthesis monooxygenase [Paramarasmius palmivorus]|uniref:Ubiquinone biosynthesis monooxygenase COQ6, mitochondrial n=1 Tax=Paramarasmius palmivorus TaxID=297713 RepID=A0AAW0E9A2_9AGAR